MINLTICIPTRNRADLAINAVNSILNSKNENVNVLISDNSTDHEEKRKLLEFSEKVILKGGKLFYVKPENCSMTEHWDWMINFAMNKFPEATHFSILTDRMVFKKNALIELKRLMEKHPDKLISYNMDRLNDIIKPYVFEYYAYSGNLLEIYSDNFLQLVSECIFHPAIPRMLNNVVPKFILEDFTRKYGSIFSSVSPDFNFAFRYLSDYETFYYFDKTLIYHYGINRSNGASASRGEMSKDHEDFLKNLQGTSLAGMAPIPEVVTASNSIIHEYFYAKKETKNKKFPEINMKKYSQFIILEVLSLKNKKLKKELLTILKIKYSIDKKSFYSVLVHKLFFRFNKKSIHFILEKFIDKYFSKTTKRFYTLLSAFQYLDDQPYLAKTKTSPILLTVVKEIKKMD